jgi:hypothetical protein
MLDWSCGANLGVAMWRLTVLVTIAFGSATVGFVPTASQDSGTVVTVTAGKRSEFALTLSRSSVPLGMTVFDVTNRGRLPHQFTVCTTAVARATSHCHGLGTRILSPGQSATLTIGE